MQLIIVVSLIVAAIIHLMPVVGVLGAEHLNKLYGVDMTDPNLLILMRHRAILFALLGIGLLIAAFKPEWRSAAFVFGLISTIAFIALAVGEANINPQVQRVLLADGIAIAFLLLGSGLHFTR